MLILKLFCYYFVTMFIIRPMVNIYPIFKLYLIKNYGRERPDTGSTHQRDPSNY